MKKCPNKHFYHERFASCPFCKMLNQAAQPATPSESVPARSSPAVEGFGHTVIIDPVETNQHLQELEREFHQGSTTPPPMPVQSSYAPPVMSPPPQPKSALADEIKGRTIYIDPPHAEPNYPVPPPPSTGISAVQHAKTENDSENKPVSSAPIEHQGYSQNVVSPLPSGAVSETPKSTTATSGAKTKILFGDVEPVVGWLICLKGAYVGESFPLKTGQNFIGRSVQMDVPLLDEESVSRDSHAFIIFEPEKAEFFASNGQGNSLTYLNKELLMQPTKLNNYDILRFGECEYLFLALCCEKFSWNTYLGK